MEETAGSEVTGMWEMSSAGADVFFFFFLCFYLGSDCPGLLAFPQFCNPSSLKTLRQRAGVSAEIPRFLRSYSEDAFQRQTWKVQSFWHVIQEQRFMSETTSHCKCRDEGGAS